MQEGRKCIFVILQEKQLVLRYHLYFIIFDILSFNKNVNTLSLDLHYG